MVVLRVGRRRTAWESATAEAVDQIIKTEFSSNGELELDASVYLIEESDLIRTVAEHSAGSGCDPPRGFDNINLDDGRPLVESAGETGFQFTTAAHRELRFESEAALKDFLVTRIIPQIAERKYVATKAQVRAYVKAQKDADDPEWVAFLAKNDRWP